MGLENIQVGDELLCSGRYDNVEFAKVTRITATQVQLDNGSKVMKRNGVQVGTSSSWHTKYWRKATEDDHAKHGEALRIEKIRDGLALVKATPHNMDLIEAFLRDLSKLTAAKPPAE